jgi:rhodanese-related sulfurtransferase
MSVAGAHPEPAIARVPGLGNAGAVSPDVAYDMLSAGNAILVDVRTAEELKQAGSVPGAIHVAWATGPAMIKNPRFLKDLSAKVPRERTVLFMCRSGKRSAEAAAAAAKAGYENAFQLLEGYEGLARKEKFPLD